MSFAMSQAARERFNAVEASPLYPQIQAMNRRLNKMPAGSSEYDQLRSELFALRDQAAGGSPTPDMSQPPPFGGGISSIWAGSDGRGDVIRGDGRLMTTSVLPRQSWQRQSPWQQSPWTSRLDPPQRPSPYTPRGGGFFGRLGDRLGNRLGNRMPRRPPPWMGGGQFGGRWPFPQKYRGMPRMGGDGRFGGMQRPPFISGGEYRKKMPYFGGGVRPPFGGGFRPPFYQRHRPRPHYNPIPQIDPDAFRQYRQRLDQPPSVAPPVTGFTDWQDYNKADVIPAYPDLPTPSFAGNSGITDQIAKAAGFAQSLPRITPAQPVGISVAQHEREKEWRANPTPIPVGSDPSQWRIHAFGTPDPMVYQGTVPSMQPAEMYLRGGIGSIGGMMGGAGGSATPSISRLPPEVIAAAEARRNMNRR